MHYGVWLLFHQALSKITAEHFGRCFTLSEQPVKRALFRRFRWWLLKMIGTH